MEERRESTRFNVAFNARHWLVKYAFGTVSPCQNISIDGICFPALQRLEPKFKIGLTIELPEFSKPINAKAEIMWLHDIGDHRYRYLAGAKFIEISPIDRNRILDLCYGIKVS